METIKQKGNRNKTNAVCKLHVTGCADMAWPAPELPASLPCCAYCLLVGCSRHSRVFVPPLSTCRRGWFPSSYTKLLEDDSETTSVPAPSSAPVRSVSTMNLSEKSSVVIPPPDYLECLSTRAAADKKVDASSNTAAFKAPVSKPGPTPPVSRAVA
uniref:Brain-specific angiogenesis inhibitor 1-associated protein 2-like protein 1 n=1 Tax=Sus scrofa TaxID=9823 RepID=A0A480WV84_PIG